MPIDKRTGKYYPAEEGYGDLTGPPEVSKPKAKTSRPVPKQLFKNLQKPKRPGDSGLSEMPDSEAGSEPQMKKGGKVKKYAKGGAIDGCARKGKTKGRMV